MSQMTNKETAAKGAAHFMTTYAQIPIALHSGAGMYVSDAEGKNYLDFVAGIAVNALGYGDAELKSSLKAVIDSGLTHCSNLYWNEPAVNASALLAELSGLDRVFFCNSGAEANEAAIKLARKFGFQQKGADASAIISMKDSFHGRTYGAITATGQTKYHAGFAPLMPDIHYAEFNSPTSLQEMINEKTCGVFIEPVQGEGGIHPADKTFLQEARALCDQFNALLIFDEVQCGIGRSGHSFAYQHYGVTPDVVTLAKGLGGGIPIGAAVANERAAAAFSPGDHASTFGGNLISAAAAQTVLSRLKEGSLLTHVQKIGGFLTDGLLKLQEKHPALIREVRGLGLMQGIELTKAAAPYLAECVNRGLLLVGAGKDIIRFVPPLIVTEQDIDRMLFILDHAIEYVEGR